MVGLRPSSKHSGVARPPFVLLCRHPPSNPSPTAAKTAPSQPTPPPLGPHQTSSTPAARTALLLPPLAARTASVWLRVAAPSVSSRRRSTYRMGRPEKSIFGSRAVHECLHGESAPYGVRAARHRGQGQGQGVTRARDKGARGHGEGQGARTRARTRDERTRGTTREQGQDGTAHATHTGEPLMFIRCSLDVHARAHRAPKELGACARAPHPRTSMMHAQRADCSLC